MSDKNTWKPCPIATLTKYLDTGARECLSTSEWLFQLNIVSAENTSKRYSLKILQSLAHAHKILWHQQCYSAVLRKTMSFCQRVTFALLCLPKILESCSRWSKYFDTGARQCLFANKWLLSAWMCGVCQKYFNVVCSPSQVLFGKNSLKSFAILQSFCLIECAVFGENTLQVQP